MKVDYLFNPPVINKLLYRDYELYDLCKYNFDEYLPGARYVWLQRKDFCSAAVSLYFVQSGMKHKRPSSFIWNTRNLEQLERTQGVRHTFDGPILLEYYDLFKSHHEGWAKFFESRPHLSMDYEHLVADPEGCASLVLSYMGLEGKPDVNKELMPLKLEHRQKPEYLARLRELVGTGRGGSSCTHLPSPECVPPLLLG